MSGFATSFGAVELRPTTFADDRGRFAEVWNAGRWSQTVGPTHFVQDNIAQSRDVGTLRGLHFQIPPQAQGKLVRCVAGAVLDVAVDIRAGSPTYGRHIAVRLTGADWNQLWVPRGFAHGYLALEPDSIVEYKVTDSHWSREHERGLAFDDPALAIAWPLPPERILANPRDRSWPRLADLPAYFTYEGAAS